MRALAWYMWLQPWCLAASTANHARPYSEAIDNGTYGSYPVQTYATERQLTSPRINWLQWSPDCDDGRLHFITPRGSSLSNPGPMILDGNGNLIWSHFFDNGFGGQAYDLKVQHYRGQDYLTFWLGNDAVRGHGAGTYYMLDNSYTVVHEVKAAAGFDADLHEFLITPQGTALLTVYDKHHVDLSSFRDFDPDEDKDDEQPDYVWDCLIQEINIETGLLLFQWRVSDHVDLTGSFRDIGDEGTHEVPWDWYHVNSIAKDDLGNYLISARYTHTITYIDGKTGQILWTLGGKRNSFMNLSHESGISFACQHDARFHALDAFPEIYTAPRHSEGVTRRLLTLFDNAVDDTSSQGLLLELTFPDARAATYDRSEVTMENRSTPNGTDPDFTVRLINSYKNPRNVRSTSQGSMQILEGEQTKVLVGYGFDAVWTEFDINGTVLCDIHYGAETSWKSGDVQSYRSLKFEWTGKPTTSPKIEISDDNLELYMSWNGATEVAAWLVQAAKTAEAGDDDWVDVVRAKPSGFETTVDFPVISRGASSRFLRAQAISSDGSILAHGTSKALDRGEQYSTPVLDMIAWMSTRHLVIAALVVAAAVFCFGLLKKLRNWRLGRPAAGPIRWKQGIIYRRLSGDA